MIVEVGIGVTRVGGVDLDRGVPQFPAVHGGEHVERGLGRRILRGGRHLAEWARRIALRGDRADLAGHVDDPGGRCPAQQRQHGVGHGDHAEDVELVHRPHAVE